MISGLIITLSAINQQYTVYQNNKFNSNFQLGNYDVNSCNVPSLQKIYNEKSLLDNLFISNLTIQATDSFILTYKITNLINNDYIIESNLEDSSNILNEKIIYISHVCPEEQDLENYNYWGLLKIQLIINNQQFDIYFESICSKDYEPQKFDFSYLIIVITGVFFVFLTSRFGQIASLQIVSKKFQGIHINYLYFVLFVLTVLILLAFSFIAIEVEIYILAFISYISCVFYLIDICCFIKISYWNHQKDYPFYILGFILGSIPIITFFSLGFNWVINDVIFLFNLGTYFKLFKVVSFKDCLTIYIPFVIFNCLLNLFVYLRLELGIEITNALNLTQFFSLQAPMFDFIPTRRCAYIEINTLFLPGLMIAYTVRYAKASKSFVYFIIYFLGLFLGLICWLATTFANSKYQITSLLFTIIPSSILAAILCYYRNELQVFYKGQFYDSILDDPFRVNNDMKESAKVNTELVSSTNQELPVINPSLFIEL